MTDSGWTVDTLKMYLDRILDEKKAALDAALLANDHRLEAMNQFREQLNKQSATFLTIETYETAHTQLEDQLASAVREWNVKLEGHQRESALAHRTLNDGINRNTLEIATKQAADTGVKTNRDDHRASNALIASWAVTAFILLGLVASVVGLILR